MSARRVHAAPRFAPLLALACLLSLVTASTTGCRASSTSRTEAERRLDDVRRSSSADDHLVLVAFVSENCAPCRRLETETWLDPRVVSRVNAAGASTFRFGVEELPHAASELDVVALPQVIAWRRGVEVDRVRGFVTPESFVEWIDALERGGTRLGVLRDRANARPRDGAIVHAWATEALRRDALGEATDAYERLWSMPASARGEGAVRVPDETEELARRSPAARERLARRCASLEAIAAGTNTAASASSGTSTSETSANVTPSSGRGGADPAATSDASSRDEARGDWIDLAHALAEDARVAAWFSTLSADDVRGEVVQSRRETVWRALRAAGRFDEIVRFVEVSVPATSFARARAVETAFEREMFDAPSLAAMRVERARDLDDLRRGCLATGRAADAAEIERLARENGLK